MEKVHQNLLQLKLKTAKQRKMQKKYAFSIANSPLVKTALAGEDPNWGRISNGNWKSKCKFKSIKNYQLNLGNIKIIENGKFAKFLWWAMN